MRARVWSVLPEQGRRSVSTSSAREEGKVGRWRLARRAEAHVVGEDGARVRGAVGEPHHGAVEEGDALALELEQLRVHGRAGCCRVEGRAQR